MQKLSYFFDEAFIKFTRKFGMPFARFSLFVVFFWFGILKVIGESPANPLVSELLGKTIPFMTFDTFIVIFGIFEMVIGLSFLFPKIIRVSIAMLGFHMITTFMPLVLMPEIAWQKPFVPTLEGQYIIKNLLIIATAMSIVSHMHLPYKKRSKFNLTSVCLYFTKSEPIFKIGK